MAWQLCRHLQDKGVAVTVLAPQIEGANEFDAQSDLRIKRFPLVDPETTIAKWRQKLALVKTLSQAAKEFQADCILCTGWDPCAYVARLAIRDSLRIPFFLIAHGMELMQLPRGFAARRAKALMRRRALLGARRIFAVSNFTRERVIELGVPPERVSVVPNGVDIQTTKTNGHRNGGARVLLTVSRLVPRKGHDTVLRAMPRVLERVPDALYRIVGTGPELERLQELSRELRLDQHVEFHGQVNDSEREDLLNDCDVFVLASRQTPTDFEGFGIAVLEAMQNGKPVVVTRAGGVPEVVEHARTGLVVEPDDSDAVAQAVISLFESRNLASDLGKNAEVVVREKYGWDNIASQYLTEMETALSRN
jgi:phosphatidylinositol alpha-1,6-mannosyltransferase